MGTFLLKKASTMKSQFHDLIANENFHNIEASYQASLASSSSSLSLSSSSSSSSSSSTIFDENSFLNNRFNSNKLKSLNQINSTNNNHGYINSTVTQQPCSFKIEDILNSNSIFNNNNKKQETNSNEKQFSSISNSNKINLPQLSSISPASSSSLASSLSNSHKSKLDNLLVSSSNVSATELIFNHASSLLNVNPFINLSNAQAFFQTAVPSITSAEHNDEYLSKNYSPFIDHHLEIQKQQNPYSFNFNMNKQPTPILPVPYSNVIDKMSASNNNNNINNNDSKTEMNTTASKLFMIDQIARQIDSLNESNANSSVNKKKSNKKNKIKANKMVKNCCDTIDETSDNNDSGQIENKIAAYGSCNGNCNDTACCKCILILNCNLISFEFSSTILFNQ
jgi:hypothetical protein